MKTNSIAQKCQQKVIDSYAAESLHYNDKFKNYQNDS